MRVLAVMIGCLVVMGCGGEAEMGVGLPAVDRAAADAKPEHRFVVSAIDVPDKSAETDPSAFDLDGDRRHSVDNKIAAVVQLAASLFEDDVQGRITGEMASGRMIVLGSLRWNGGLEEDDVALELFHGERLASGELRVEPGSPSGLRAYGHVHGGRFVVATFEEDDGTTAPTPFALALKLSLAPDVAPIALELVGVRAELELDERGVVGGKIGGAIRRSDVDARVMGPLFALFQQWLATNPPAEAARSFRADTDADHDGTITELEFRTSDNGGLFSFTPARLFLPDVDVLGGDGVLDSISLGFKFTATAATF